MLVYRDGFIYLVIVYKYNFSYYSILNNLSNQLLQWIIKINNNIFLVKKIVCLWNISRRKI